MKEKGNSISIWNRDCYLPWIFALITLIISVYKFLRKREVVLTNSLPFPAIDFDLNGDFETIEHSTNPYVDLPILDATRNIPLIKFIAKKQYKYIVAIGFCWLVIFLPGIIASALDGSLITFYTAINLSQKIPVALMGLRNFLLYVSRSNPTLAFFEDTGLLIIIAILFPLFMIMEVSLYPQFGPMIAQLHVEGIHVKLARRLNYDDCVKKYDRIFNSNVKNIIALCFSALVIYLLIRSRMHLDWWGDQSRFWSHLYTIIFLTYGGYHLWGIGTFKGWAGVTFCREYLSSDFTVLNLQPFHPDRSNGLGKVGHILVSVYWGALITGLTLFCLFIFEVFQDWTGIFALFVFIGLIDYSIFVTYPTVLVINQARKFRYKKLSKIRKKIQEVQNILKNSEIWHPDMSIELDIYLAYLDNLIKSWNLYESMHSLPLTLRQISVGLVFYIAQVAQVLVIMNIIAE